MSTVAVVMKNADFTEGRGPMLLHKIFDTVEHAEEYVSKQSGIYGTPQRKDKYGWNGYDVNVVEVLTDTASVLREEEEIARKQAMNKLTPRERELLGLKF